MINKIFRFFIPKKKEHVKTTRYKGNRKVGLVEHKYESRFDIHGYDKEGYSKYGYDKEGYNKYGFNLSGYDRDGYDRSGYNNNGYNRWGFNKEGYDKEGYNSEGYNRRNFNREGFNQNGYNEFGYDRYGIHKSGANIRKEVKSFNFTGGSIHKIKYPERLQEKNKVIAPSYSNSKKISKPHDVSMKNPIEKFISDYCIENSVEIKPWTEKEMDIISILHGN